MVKRKKRGIRIFNVKRSFRKEVARQVRLAIIAAIGFTIAFAWRDAIYNSSKELVKKFTEAANVALTEIYTAIFITIAGVLLIFLSSRFLREKR